MDNDELVKYMELSDVPETYQPIVSLIGLDAFLKLCSYGSGSRYISRCRKQYIRRYGTN